MRAKHVKVQWKAEPNPVQALVHHVDLNPEECFRLALKAEELDEAEWAEHWLQKAVLEEHELSEQLRVGM